MKLNSIQADIVFKALHYVCVNEKIEVPEEYEEIFRVLAEENPRETNAVDSLDVMEHLSEFIKNSEEYQDYFEVVEEDED